MKKALLLLLLSLAMSSASALSRRVDYGGYKIGSSDVMTDDPMRISYLPCLVHDTGLQTSVTLTANATNGQKIVRWWAYQTKGHTQYNNIVNLANDVYSFDWTYNTASYSPAYVVVDYDYIKYNLSYNANGGSGSFPTQNNIIYTNAVAISDNQPSRTGYTWSGWTNNLTTTVWHGGDTVTGESLGLRSIVDGSNVVLYAKWEVNSYTVTLDQQDGSGGAESVTATYGAAMPATNMPTRTGYTFGGYYTGTNGSGTQYYTAEGASARDYNLTTATNLFAKWTANKYTVTFDKQEGTGGTSSVRATYDSAMPSATMPTRTGYTFGGYYTEANGSGTQYYSAGGESVNVWKELTDTTLYAKWEPNTRTIGLDWQGGSGGDASVNVTYGAPMPQATMPERAGYIFDGYYFFKNGGGDKYYNADGSSARNWDKDADNLQLYANWRPNQYVVTLDQQDGVGGVASVTVEYEKEMPQIEEFPERAGYAFGGYYTAAGGDGTQYYASNGTSARKWDMTASTTLYAKWMANHYEVSFTNNSAEAAGNMQNEGFAYGEEKALTSNAFARVGYTFAGWAKSADGQVEYTDGQIVSNLTTAASAVVPLFAAWAPIEYTIAFDGNEADNPDAMEGDSIPVAYDAVVTLPESKFVKQGRLFRAWRHGDVTYDVGDSVSNLTTEAGATVTFSAVWSELRYASFDGNGADNADAMVGDVITFDGIETKALAPNKFEKTGYTFGGWATNDVEAAALKDAYADGADVVSTNLWMDAGKTNVFYAVWQTNTYNVVFNRNGGNGNMAPQTFVYDQPQQLNSRGFNANLNFAGWATNSTGEIVFTNNETVVNLTAEANGTVTLYAVWDNGDLSKAMHCDNLVWETEWTGTEWVPITGPSEGYAQSGSAVSNGVFYTDDMVNTRSRKLKVHSSQPETKPGKLSFWYKTSCDDSSYYSLKFIEKEIAFSPVWKEYGPVDVSDIRDVVIILEQVDYNNGYGCSVWIDQMTWVPDGVEPTEDDMPTINGFTATVDGFTLSVDDGNISDSFSYQILATNELVSGDWPVKTNLTAEAIKAGYDIVPEANEPKMFYKVKVISK